MIRARLSNGTFLLGLDFENVRRLLAGEPIRVDLTLHGGHDVVGIMYGETLADIMRELRALNGGDLPPVQPMPNEPDTPQ
jgi:hypothetical protein